ncbi:hypothetical protein [Novosphingobium sp. AAP93]|uniref:hypothetical protein n=1 Tax=Novosphingobium sp. AAP93 TaxID=1523427 RepID=UPI0012E1C570|nr:hypothetical protein [Novosphingobium sp. AAP93]
MKSASILVLVSLSMGVNAFPSPEDGWIFDGVRLCTFDANIGKSPTRCSQYHQVISHKLKGGQVWNEYRWMWKDGKFEVQYTSRVGSLGISQFTIGEVAYRNVGISRFMKSQAVSYAASREEIIIGIPGDDYQFVMKGAV